MEDDINVKETPEVPAVEDKPTWVVAAEATPGVEMKRRKIVSNEEFIRTWNQSLYVKDVAETLGISANSARARANKLRKIFAQAGVNINLKKHPRHVVRRKSLINDMDELQRLAQIAKDSLPSNNEANESDN
tara:strand:+ start:38 stop:433 length:396 start_codon:yes stop_codon:yes gene_type:complete